MLIGRGALANYHDIPADVAEDFNHWHTTEHLPERVGVPGFLRGRRYRAIDAGTSPEYFILYETTDVEVLRSGPYVARLDAPTPWTSRVSARMTRTIRTAARVRASAGRGVGGFMLTVRLAPGAAAVTSLREALGEEHAGTLAARPGLCGVHVLEADAAVTGIETRERRMREPPDELVPWMLLLEGTSPAALEQAWQQARSRVAPECAARAGIGVYALQTVFALCDL